MKFDQDGIVLYIMQALKQQGSWTGETHVQKTLYLCQVVLGVNSGFKYILYKHGPYSFELSAHLQMLISDGLVSVHSRPPYGPVLDVSNEGKSIGESLSSEDVGKKIEFMTKKIGRKNVAELERLATAVYILFNYNIDGPLDKQVQCLTSIKPHVTADLARAAFFEVETIRSEAREVLRA